ncbi:hypothetical protein L345_02252, partial [Ophiophagus hannah]
MCKLLNDLWTLLGPQRVRGMSFASVGVFFKKTKNKEIGAIIATHPFGHFLDFFLLELPTSTFPGTCFVSFCTEFSIEICMDKPNLTTETRRGKKKENPPEINGILFMHQNENNFFISKRRDAVLQGDPPAPFPTTETGSDFKNGTKQRITTVGRDLRSPCMHFQCHLHLVQLHAVEFMAVAVQVEILAIEGRGTDVGALAVQLGGPFAALVVAPDVVGESPAVGLVEEGVHEGVDPRADVAHPNKHVQKLTEDPLVAGLLAEDGHDVGDKKRAPHNQEQKEDDPQDLGGPAFVVDGLHGAFPEKDSFFVDRRHGEVLHVGVLPQAAHAAPPRFEGLPVEEEGGLLLQHLDGQAVGDHHDHQGDEEGHEGADEDEVFVVQDTASVHKDPGIVLQADDWDGQGNTWRRRHAKKKDHQEKQTEKKAAPFIELATGP